MWGARGGGWKRGIYIRWDRMRGEGGCWASGRRGSGGGLAPQYGVGVGWGGGVCGGGVDGGCAARVSAGHAGGAGGGGAGVDRAAGVGGFECECVYAVCDWRYVSSDVD